MQEQEREAEGKRIYYVLLWVVKIVSNNRETEMRRVNADLMCTPGFWRCPQKHHLGHRGLVENCKVRNRRLEIIFRVADFPHERHVMSLDWRIYSKRIPNRFRPNTIDNTEILLFDFSSFELSHNWSAHFSFLCQYHLRVKYVLVLF